MTSLVLTKMFWVACMACPANNCRRQLIRNSGNSGHWTDPLANGTSRKREHSGRKKKDLEWGKWMRFIKGGKSRSRQNNEHGIVACFKPGGSTASIFRTWSACRVITKKQGTVSLLTSTDIPHLINRARRLTFFCQCIPYRMSLVGYHLPFLSPCQLSA